MTKFDHLSPQARPIAALKIPERIAWLERAHLIPIPSLQQVEETLRKSVAKKAVVSIKPLTMLAAPSGMGSSTMLEQLVNSFPPCFDSQSRVHTHPVIFGHLPAEGKMRDLYAELCEAIAAPSFGAAAVTTTPRCLQLLKSANVGLIIIDDFGAISTMSQSRRACALSFIRTAISRFDIDILINVTPDVVPIIMQDAQLGTRAQVVEVLAFKANDTDFEGFLGDFARWCPLRREPDLQYDHSLRKALIRRTGGITRNLMDVLIRLAVFAIYSAEERITYRLFREYFSRAEYDYD
jgi:hypothetical protein